MATPKFVVVGAGNHAVEQEIADNPENGRHCLDMLSQICRLVEAQRPGALCIVFQFRGDVLECAAAPGLSPESIALLNAQRTSREASQLDATVLWRDLGTCPMWRGCLAEAADLGIESCLAAPIASGDRPAGMVALHYRRGEISSPADRELLEIASHLAAMAIARHDLQNSLQLQARHDALTGLPGRMHFLELLTAAIEKSAARSESLAVLCVGLDRFHQINDNLGHETGDRLLEEAARRLRGSLDEGALAGRTGGDEFSVVLTPAAQQDALNVAERLLEVFRAPFQMDGHEVYSTASLGVSLFPDHGGGAAELLRHADVAMRSAKNSGRNGVRIFHPDTQTSGLDRLKLESALRRALDNRELEVLYQPLVDMRGRVQGFEALLSWRHAVYGNISPADFIPIAEETGLIIDIGAWVLEQACQEATRWRKAGYRQAKVSVNVSALQLERNGFVETVAAALAISGLPPECLELELTESYIMKNLAPAATRMAQIRELGVSIAIDDFGTGYSSLSYLSRLPVDSLKIDQSFLRGMQDPESSLPVIQSIVRLAHSMKLTVVVEGVETAEELDLVRLLGCDKVQGYFYGGALAPQAVDELLAREEERAAAAR